ncbi:hypothetical protein H1O16_gp259 [Burkholderia phage BcepSaruman]|uniref:Uncharacterized protein n=1 Tax=Burkholderia phage BcepSaruman TaxID=2530032 RepID=A0A4D5ZGN8_9CAUD|nr:hypothetical protein H1O16_gp259 [Burkholderia phage BcepSaruman]QBX06672.1 hypothetical protein BcepSaruman_259 [Burkholderia phage BcepSaruman]
MGFAVNDRLEVSLFINDQEFPLDSLNVLHFLHIAWGTRGLVPTIHLSVFDAQHTLDAVPLQDGIPIRVAIRAYQGQTQTYNFRKYDHKKTNTGNGFTYRLDGYLDVPKYWLGTSVVGIRGTSNEVLNQIATSCGMKYEGVSTADSQLWLPRNRTYAEFARHVADAGYATDSSYMEMAVTSYGAIRYLDVNALPQTTTKVTLGQFVQGSLTAADYKPHARSGMNNKMTGYQNTKHSQSLSGDVLNSAASTLVFNPDSSAPLFNAKVREDAARGYQTFGGIDVGNTHANYDKALYQNLRYSNLFSLDVEFLMASPTTFEPMDTFSFIVDQETNLVDRAYAGTYTVVARAIFITGATYAEKILGTRSGMDTTYTSG